jgi:hypothetical protein
MEKKVYFADSQYEGEAAILADNSSWLVGLEFSVYKNQKRFTKLLDEIIKGYESSPLAIKLKDLSNDVLLYENYYEERGEHGFVEFDIYEYNHAIVKVARRKD